MQHFEGMYINHVRARKIRCPTPSIFRFETELDDATMVREENHLVRCLTFKKGTGSIYFQYEGVYLRR